MDNLWFQPVVQSFDPVPPIWVNMGNGNTICPKAIQEWSDSKCYGSVVMTIQGETHTLWYSKKGYRRERLSGKDLEMSIQDAMNDAIEMALKIIESLGGTIWEGSAAQ